MIRKVIADGKEKGEVTFENGRWVWFLSGYGKTRFKKGTSIGDVLEHIYHVLCKPHALHFLSKLRSL